MRQQRDCGAPCGRGDRLAALRIRLLTYSTKPRGGVVHALALAEALQQRGHDMELWALSVDGAGFFREPNVPVHLVPVERRDDEDIDRRILRYADALAGGLREAGPVDVEHSEDCLSARSLLSLRTEGRTGEIVRTVHHVDEFRSPVLDACQRASILKVDHVICVSRYWADQLEDQFGAESVVIPNGIDADRFRAPDLTRADARSRFGWGGRQVVLAVGGIEPRKGSLELLRAFALLKETHPNAVLAIAGGETLFDYRDYRDAWHGEADRLGLRVDSGADGSDVVAMGRIDDPDMPALYRGADALAMPSMKEGFGLVAVEAMAAGCPVVLTDLPVFREHFSDGGDCLMVPVGDIRRLSAALGEVLGTGARHATITQGGQTTASRFSWEAAAEAHERFYAEVM